LDSRIAPIEAEAIPFPREETTPPVTNINRVSFSKTNNLIKKLF